MTDGLSQEQLAEIFVAQRKLLAELQRLRDANDHLRREVVRQKMVWGVPEEVAWSHMPKIEAGEAR